MDAGGSTHPIRKAFGAIKDSTRVGLAMVNSGHKEVDVAVVKATSHDEVLPKEKHVQTIFDAVSDSKPQADIAYCIHALGRRLAKTHNWTVALKTLIVIHRALREVYPTFREELIHHNQSGELILNLSHFSDDSSRNAWEYSAWVRSYALYIEELLECFRTLNYDVQIDHSRTKDLDTPDLLEQLTALQQLLFRLLACQPEEIALDNFLIQHALAMVADESIKVYLAISDGTLNLADKFFQMQRRDAVRALEIYKKTGNQAERLSEFFEICRGLDFGQGQEHFKIEQPSASLLTAMKGHVKDAAQNSSSSRKSNNDEKVGSTPKSMAAFEADLEARGTQDADFLKKSDASAT